MQAAIIDFATESRRARMRTGARQQSAFQRQMRTGACPPGGGCPPGQGAMTVDQLAASRGQSVVPGALGECRWSIIPLSGTLLAANTTLTLTIANSIVGICVERIVVDVTGTPVNFQDLIFGNKPQWDAGETYDQALFNPDGRCAACCLPMDCIRAGTTVSVLVNRIPDAAADADIIVSFNLIGPTIGV